MGNTVCMKAKKISFKKLNPFFCKTKKTLEPLNEKEIEEICDETGLEKEVVEEWHQMFKVGHESKSFSNQKK